MNLEEVFSQRRRDYLGYSYLNFGWLAIAALPLAQVLGRGVFNVLGSIYLVWGLAGLIIRRPRLDRVVFALYVLILACFAASCFVADDADRAWNLWRSFLLHSLVAFPLAAALCTMDDLDRLIDAFAISGLVLTVFLYLKLALQFQQSDFAPEFMMKEDNLPLLLPFMLCATQRRIPNAWRNVFSIFIAIAVLYYIVISNGRAALLGMIVALSVYAAMVLRLSKRAILIGIAIVFVSAFLVRGDRIYRYADSQPDFYSSLNRASSFRLELWTNALTHLPRNVMFGAGMGNTPDHILRVNRTKGARLGHLHNFLLDLWHETGFLGLATVLTFVIRLGTISVRGWQSANDSVRRSIGTLLASEAAILSSACFSFSYGSRQFACYLLAFLLAGAVAGTLSTAREGQVTTLKS